LYGGFGQLYYTKGEIPFLYSIFIYTKYLILCWFNKKCDIFRL